MAYEPTDWDAILLPLAQRLEHLEAGLKEAHDALAAHAAGPDPYPGYLTQEEADARYAPIASVPPAAATAYGVPAGTSLRTLTPANNPYPANTFTSSGIYKIVTSGTFTGWKFAHRVEVHAGTVVFTNCHFSGDTIGTAIAAALLTVMTAGTGTASATRCTFDPAIPYDNLDGVRGHRFTLDACDIARTVDGVHLWAAGSVTIRNSRIRGLIFYDNNSHPNSPITGSHNDGVQINNGTDYAFIGNTFEGPMNGAGLYISQRLGATSNVRIEGNTFDITGNGADVNIYDGEGSGAIIGTQIKGNVFAKDMTKYQMIISNRTKNHASTIISGNVWEDGSSPPPTVKSGG